LRSEDQTVTSSPANRTALRAEENRPAPASQQVIASAVTGPTPYSRAARTFAPAAARELVFPVLHAFLSGLPVLADPGYDGAGQGIITPVRKPAG
jgi:hypothetical protein